MMIRQADRYITVAIKPDSLAMADAFIGQLLAMGSAFEPNLLHVGLW